MALVPLDPILEHDRLIVLDVACGEQQCDKPFSKNILECATNLPHPAALLRYVLMNAARRAGVVREPVLQPGAWGDLLQPEVDLGVLPAQPARPQHTSTRKPSAASTGSYTRFSRTIRRVAVPCLLAFGME